MVNITFLSVNGTVVERLCVCRLTQTGRFYLIACVRHAIRKIQTWIVLLRFSTGCCDCAQHDRVIKRCGMTSTLQRRSPPSPLKGAGNNSTGWFAILRHCARSRAIQKTRALNHSRIFRGFGNVLKDPIERLFCRFE